MELQMDSPLLRMKEGTSYEATLSRGAQTTGSVFLEKLGALLGPFDPETAQPSRECPISLTLLKRQAGKKSQGFGGEQTDSAGPHLFEMEIIGIQGSFELLLHPEEKIARLLPAEDLDRPAAARRLAGLMTT